MYTVKDAAKMLDMTQHTVRYYTDEGLVPSVHRDRNNNRLFDDESLNWLRSAKYLKRCGMSIKGIRIFVDLCLEGDCTVQERHEIIQHQKAIALAQLEDTRQSIAYLERKEKHFSDVINAVIPNDTNPAEWGHRNYMPVNKSSGDRTKVAE